MTLAPHAPPAAAAAAPAPTAVRDASWETLSAAVAQQAAQRARRAPAVRTVEVEVLGEPAAPALHARVGVDSAAELSATVTAFMDSVVPWMERALGVPFAVHEVAFSLADTRRSASGPASPVLTIV